MSYLPPEEEVIILSTQKPVRRWLRIALKILAVLAALAAVIAAFIGWRYYAVHKQLKHDLTQVIRQEEHVRALGGINTAPDMLIPNAPDSWRFRYISSVRARRGLDEPTIEVKSVDYDGRNARVHLLVNGIDQYRHYHLFSGKDWRRAPFEAKGWGQRQRLGNADSFQIIYWDNDEAFAQELDADLPHLAAQMHSMKLVPTTHKLNIIPQEFDDLVHPAHVGKGLTLNSPHVDIIPASNQLSPQQLIRLDLAQQLMHGAHAQDVQKSTLPGASRVRLALRELLAWHWAAGDVSDEAVTAWAQTLKGRWVSPITGLPPTAITELPPDAPDAAAHLMMAWMLRTQGPNALIALDNALNQHDTWDALYQELLGLQAVQVEAAAQALAAQPEAAPAAALAASAAPAPTRLTLLTSTPDAHGRVLAQTPAGDVILLQAQAGAHFTLLDGSPLQFDCVAAGSQVTVRGRWLEQDRRLEFSSLQLEQASLPPILRTPAMSANALSLSWRYQHRASTDISPVSLVEQLPDARMNSLVTLTQRVVGNPTTHIFSRPGQPPLMLWRQSVRCNRDWLLAYDPNIGIADAWLMPATQADIIQARYLTPDSTFELQLLENGDLTGFTTYRTADHHLLQALDPDAPAPDPQDIIPAQPSFSDDMAQQIIQHLTQPSSADTIPDVEAWAGIEFVRAVGFPHQQTFFVAQALPKATGPAWVMRIETEQPLKISTLFEISSRGRVTSIARCPDGSYLYGLEVAHSPQNQGILRLHKPSGEDIAVSELSDMLYMPVYCAGY